MDKLTLTISPEDWGSLVTKYNADSKKVSLASFTEGTINIDTDITGSITKREGNTDYNPTLLPAAAKDQFEAIFSDGARHLLVAMNGEIKYSSGDGVFNTIVNGTGFSTVANFEFATTQDRVYGGNGVNAPIVYDRATSYGGVTYTAPRIRSMGVTVPSTAPTAPGAGAAGGAVPAGAHTYKVTYLYYDSEESNGSPASGVCTVVNPNNTVNLTAIPVGGYGVTARKIYRDNNDQLWLHVGTIANNTATTFSDTVAVGVTPTEIPEFNNAPPTFSLITSWLDRLWLGKVPGDPYTLFYTETSLPDIVRPESQLLCNQEDPITAYVVYFGRLIVFNRRSLGQILGTTSDTFRYSTIPGSVGCVDNRTLQIRVIEGVPILVWLSDKGFYSYDGNAINYISDEIEDLINFNIQQAIQQNGSNTQSSQAQFQGGTASQGIDLLSNPGAITTKGYLNGTSVAGTNPRRNFDDQGDWEAGQVKTNIVTKAGDNKLKAPVRFSPTLASGILVPNAIISGSNLTLSFYNGEDKTGDPTYTGGSQMDTLGAGANSPLRSAQPIVPSTNGTITELKAKVFIQFPTSAGTFKLQLWSGTPSPTTLLFNSPLITAPLGDSIQTASCSIAVTAGVKYWVAVSILAADGVTFSPSPRTQVTPRGKFGVNEFTSNDPWRVYTTGSGWVTTGLSPRTLAVSYKLQYSQSGQWSSAIYDTFSSFISPTLNISHSSTLPAFTSSATTIEGSDSAAFLGGAEVTETVNNLSGNQNLSISGKRYWRIKILLSSTNSDVVPIVGTPILKFNQTATWVSATIDATSDVTDYISLTIVDSIPAGTSIVYAVATSTDDISYPDGFVTFGTEVVRRYIKIRAILTVDSTFAVTPDISSIILKWTLTSNLISSVIDTAVAPPAGWDIFLASFTTNGGTVTFEMRSASTALGITAATFFSVTPGEFPTSVAPLQFTQWRVTITSADIAVPFVDSVTVQWFITLVNSIRPASIFADNGYYVALAELNQLHNNLIVELDANGKWRRHAGLNVSTFSFFFNRPYFGLSTTGRIRKFLEGLTDAGASIELDIRFKASDFSTQYQNNSSKVKVVGEVILQGINTGATFQLYYSLDMGQTFIQMVTSSGSLNYVTTSDGQNFYVRFRPLWDGSNPISGRTIMYRVHNNDAYAVEIKGLEATAFLRLQAPVITG